MVEDLRRGAVAQGRLEPDVQAELGGLGHGGVETVDLARLIPPPHSSRRT
ncbi:hypothetical protein ACIO6T_08200 [Streptomyces sp. NPDC087532]